MRTRAMTRMLALGLGLGLAGAAMAQEGDDPAAARTEAARRAYLDASTSLTAGVGSPEQVYTWSLRWLDARLAADPTAAPQALVEHRDRMVGLQTSGRSLIDDGTMPAGLRHALDYYVAEAEVWVAAGERRRGP